MENINLNCHEDLSSGFELALKQLGYKILEEKSDGAGYIDYIVVKEDWLSRISKSASWN